MTGFLKVTAKLFGNHAQSEMAIANFTSDDDYYYEITNDSGTEEWQDPCHEYDHSIVFLTMVFLTFLVWIFHAWLLYVR